MPIFINEYDFNVKNVTFSTPKKSKKDNKLRSYLLYNGQQAYFETPWLRLPWPISSPYQDPDSLTKPWEISFQETACQDFETDEEKLAQKEVVTKWFDSWRDLYDPFIDFCVENSTEIFGKKYSVSQKEVVMALVSPFVKTNGDYPARLRSKVYNSKGVPDTKVYQGSPEELDIPDFKTLVKHTTKGSFIKQCLIPNVYFINKGAGISFSSKQILLQESDNIDSGAFAFNVTFKKKGVVKNKNTDTTNDTVNDTSNDTSNDTVNDTSNNLKSLSVSTKDEDGSSSEEIEDSDDEEEIVA